MSPAKSAGPQMSLRPGRAVIRRTESMRAMESVLSRVGFGSVAGADEAGRGACAGPLVAAACVLPPGKRGEVPELADSKLLTENTRERVFAQVQRRALSYAIVIIDSDECDRLGMHVANVQALRRAVTALSPAPAYTLTDGFPVDGLGTPGLAVWKGDQVAACVAAASVLAKVTRDRIMTELDQVYPQYGFAVHKGYCTSAHDEALAQHGPCPQHRRRFINVRRHLGVAVPAQERLDQVEANLNSEPEQLSQSELREEVR